jgi:hypothetical protein
VRRRPQSSQACGLLDRREHDFGKDPAELAWILEENRRLRSAAQEAGGELLDATSAVAELADELLGRLRPF